VARARQNYHKRAAVLARFLNDHAEFQDVVRPLLACKPCARRCRELDAASLVLDLAVAAAVSARRMAAR